LWNEFHFRIVANFSSQFFSVLHFKGNFVEFFFSLFLQKYLVALTQMQSFSHKHIQAAKFSVGIFLPSTNKFLFGWVGWKVNWDELKNIPRARTDRRMRSDINRHVSDEDFFIDKNEIFFPVLQFFFVFSFLRILMLLLLLYHGRMENFLAVNAAREVVLVAKCWKRQENFVVVGSRYEKGKRIKWKGRRGKKMNFHEHEGKNLCRWD